MWFLYLPVQMFSRCRRVYLFTGWYRTLPSALHCRCMMKNRGMAKTKFSRGRPRSFDTAKALKQALAIFWRKGYQGTSLSDLTKAMNINRPSLYAAFGDKAALFRKVLDYYAEGPASFSRQALQQPTSRAVVDRLLQGMAELLSCPQNPGGCLLVQGALTCASGAEAIRQELISRRVSSEAMLRERLKRAKLQGDLPLDADPAALARFVVTVMQGMSVQAAGGATRRELQHVAAIALRSWPAPVQSHKKQLGTPAFARG